MKYKKLNKQYSLLNQLFKSKSITSMSEYQFQNDICVKGVFVFNVLLSLLITKIRGRVKISKTYINLQHVVSTVYR